MDDRLWAKLAEWEEAGLLAPEEAEAIRVFETERAPGHGFRWPAILAFTFGALALGGGLLLFVAAHWDALGPGPRFALALAQVGAFHLAGAWARERHPDLATVLHTLGTLALGAGIFLAGQIFNLQEHWPGGVMLWALGAWAGWWLLRDWTQAALAALLTPIWLAGEWWVATRNGWEAMVGSVELQALGILVLALVYLGARRGPGGPPERRALAWIGGLALLPAVSTVLLLNLDLSFRPPPPLPADLAALGWAGALGLPLVLAAVLKGRRAWADALAALWALGLSFMETPVHSAPRMIALFPREPRLATYLWLALGSALMAAWGLLDGRRERVNLGVAGFALTLVAFYASSVMDKLGRAAGLMGLGLLLLVGGWFLERMRRRLVARLGGAA